MYFVYIIQNSSDNLYIGITENLEKRLHAHNTKQGALFTKNKGIFKIIFFEEYPTLAKARKREIQIKKWRREKKDAIIQRYRAGLPTKM